MYIETRYDRGIKDTLAQVKLLASPELGETVFCKENGRVLTYDGQLWMCDDFIKSTNIGVNSGVAPTSYQGDTMVFWVGSTTISKVIRSNSTGNTLLAGVCVYTSLPNEPIAIAFKGIYKVKLLYYSSPTAIGGMIRSSTAAGGGFSEMTTSMTNGVFGWTLEIPSTSSSTIPTMVRCLLRGKVEYY
jgi:hypothetical protein